MKKRLTGILTGIFFLSILFLGSSFAQAAELSVLVPTERAVYQRNDKNKADMLICVTYDAGKQITAVLWKEDLTPLSEEIALTATDTGTYEGTIPDVPAGGWYQLELSAKDTVTGNVEASQTIEKIGVGEVFITGGQSNSCNFGSTKTFAQEDMVSAFDPKTDTWQHCEDPQPCISGYSEGNGSGSPWPSAGDELYARLQVPIGFVTTGFGGATIKQLLAQHYDPIRDAIETLRPYGYRAFLLHQGEGDSGIGTKKEDYAEALLNLIEQTRKDAGYDLIWMIANAAYTPYTSAEANNEILEAQKEVCDEETIFLGPLTDDMDKDSGYRRPQDNLHFNEEGLKEHGRRWAEAIAAKLIPDYSQLPPDEPDPEPSVPSSTELPPAGQGSTGQGSSGQEPAVSATPAPTSSPAPVQPTASPQTQKKTTSKKGHVFKKGIFQYKITADSKKNKKVKVTAINIKKKKSINIPDKVKYKGVFYQVSAIDKKALKKLTKVKKIYTSYSLYNKYKSKLKGKNVMIRKH